MYPSSIHLYIFSSFVYSPLSLYISLSFKIHAYPFQSRFLYICLFFVYPPIFVSISCLSTSISLHIFVNSDWCLSLLTPLSLSQPNPHLSTCIYFYVFSIHHYLLYIFLSIQDHAYLFQSLSLFVVKSSNLVHTVSLITNNYFYLSNKKEIENDTENIQVINRNREKDIWRLDWFWIDEGIEKVGCVHREKWMFRINI